MPLFDSVSKFKNQDYAKLKKECQTKGTLFIDTEFPPDERSLSSTPGKYGGVVWKRPKQICTDPKLFVEGASSGDVSQGKLGNCWFVAASSCLASFKEVWHKVIPDQKNQEWDSEKPNNYQGIFHFHFWRYGHWIDVVVDDLLPTINDQLIFIHSQSKNEFWSALLEKAYAKLFGNYEALDGGELSEALEDFTGGVSDTINLVEMEVATKPEERVALFSRMQKEMDRKSLMAASIPATSAADMEATTASGLVKGHAYGITSVKNVHLEGSGLFGLFNREKLPMIRLRNPWGKGEWKGAFSDGSTEWNKISKSDREKIGLTFDEDGEFWMTFEDYCKHFVQTCICRVVNTSYLSLAKTWHEGLAHGQWKVPDRAGGCPNNQESFVKNPQYMFDITEEGEECMIQLMQKSTRDKQGSQNVTIGFTILKVELNREYRIHDLYLHEKIKSTVYKNSRSIFLRHGPMKKGRYVVIPSTFDPGEVAQYLFRVYTNAANNFKELTQEKPVKAWYNCCGKNPVMVTHIKIVRATGLEKQDRTGGADPYCIITCEGQKVTTSDCKSTTDPEWNVSALFYRKNPVKNPVTIQIWNNNIIKDNFMGKLVFASTDDFKNQGSEHGLTDRKNESNTTRPGKLAIIVTQSRSLMSI
uniref:Calpain catalytic domain-containing protein n=1 Tax=Arion vulgaris TaxID=1028688 RepID=A0A0B7B7Z1_9EUPU